MFGRWAPGRPLHHLTHCIVYRRCSEPPFRRRWSGKQTTGISNGAFLAFCVAAHLRTKLTDDLVRLLTPGIEVARSLNQHGEAIFLSHLGIDEAAFLVDVGVEEMLLPSRGLVEKTLIQPDILIGQALIELVLVGEEFLDLIQEQLGIRIHDPVSLLEPSEMVVGWRGWRRWWRRSQIETERQSELRALGIIGIQEHSKCVRITKPRAFATQLIMRKTACCL